MVRIILFIPYKSVYCTIKPVFHQKRHSRWVIFADPTWKKLHKHHEIYMANANQTLLYPTRTIVNWLALGLTLGLPGFAWVCQASFWVSQASCWVSQALHWVRQVFGILTCWYRQRESLTLGVLPNTKSQCEGICAAVGYRLKSKGVS